MNKTIATLTASLILVSIALATPKRLTNFDGLMKALNMGNTVNLVLDYGKMKLKVGEEFVESPKAIGGMAFTPWEYFAKGVINNEKAYVVSSETHLITSRKYGYVYNYVRVRIFEDQKVEINARYMTTDKYETVMDETFYSEISNGKDEKGVGVFIKP
jgi:hypothetical protein